MAKAAEKTVEEVAAPKAEKTVPYTITASYKVRNDEDGTMERVKHEGTGETPTEALKAIKDYPKGLNLNILFTVTHGDKTSQKSLAPHNARAIMENHDMYIFERQFRGI